MAKMKLYVVMKRGLEYNDEYYYTSEEGGGKAVQAFQHRKNAEKILETVREESLKDLSKEDLEYSVENGNLDRNDMAYIEEVEVADFQIKKQ